MSGLSLVPGGGMACSPQGVGDPGRAGGEQAAGQAIGEGWLLPGVDSSTLSELFAASPRDGGWAGLLLAQVDATRPLLWVQERMAILESGRVHPPGFPFSDLIHVEARDAKAALWAMEEGLRCAAIGAVIGEIWGDPAALDFTATRRLAVAAERHGVAAYLIRLGGSANLSGARLRWRVASGPSLPHPFNPRAPGAAVWEAELFRARGAAPGCWVITHERGDRTAGGFHLVTAPGDRALGETGLRQAGCQ
ncbi:MAG: recA-like protein [Sphingomicrobium sp.]